MDYTDLKGVVEHLLSFLHLSAPCYRQMEAHPFLLPCVELMLPDGEGQVRAGVLGRVRPDMADAFHARKAIWLAELDLEVLRRLHDAARVRFRPLPVYPPVRRDITVMAAPQVQVAQIMEHVRGLRLPLLEDIVLQDCFEPEGSEERNLTFRLTFRHAERTLKDAEVDKEREKVAQSLIKHLGVRI